MRRVLRCQLWLKRCGRPSPAGQITEAEAEALSVLIEARQASDTAQKRGQSPNPIGTAWEAGTAEPQKLVQARRTGVGSRPRTDASLERRRRWAASGRLPPALAAKFSLAEHAVLALIAAETARRGDCRLSVPHLAALAGVAETTVRNAIREPASSGCLPSRNGASPASATCRTWSASSRRNGRPGCAWRGRGHRRGVSLPEGWVQITEPHAYSSSRTGENESTTVLKKGTAAPVSPSQERSRNAAHEAAAMLWKATRRPHADENGMLPKGSGPGTVA